MNLLARMAAVGGIVLALITVYPGVLTGLFFLGMLLSPFGFLALAVGGAVIPILEARRAKEPPVDPDSDLFGEGRWSGKWFARCRRSRVLACGLVILSLALFVTRTPRRVAFLLSRSAFQTQVAAAFAGGGREIPLGRMLGVYYVDRYAADPRGGVYFRTFEHPDGIGPDSMSYGFAFRPNPQGTPFGNSHYGYSQIAGDWYVFSASDDW